MDNVQAREQLMKVASELRTLAEALNEAFPLEKRAQSVSDELVARNIFTKDTNTGLTEKLIESPEKLASYEQILGDLPELYNDDIGNAHTKKASKETGISESEAALDSLIYG